MSRRVNVTISVTGKKGLAVAIIKSAVDDYFHGNHPEKKEDAEKFLFSQKPHWKRIRGLWCQIAGTTPEHLLRKAKEMRKLKEEGLGIPS